MGRIDSHHAAIAWPGVGAALQGDVGSKPQSGYGQCGQKCVLRHGSLETKVSQLKGGLKKLDLLGTWLENVGKLWL